MSPCSPVRMVPACSIRRRAARSCSVSRRPSRAMVPPAEVAGGWPSLGDCTGRVEGEDKAPARKEAPAVGGAAAADDTVIIALELEAAPLSPAMAAYFEKCREKLGFVPNVLKAYAFDMPKLEAFVAMYNDLMLAPSGLSKLEREMIAVAVSSHNRCYYCLVAHGAAARQLSRDPALGELMVMNYRAAPLSPRHRAM